MEAASMSALADILSPSEWMTWQREEQDQETADLGPGLPGSLGLRSHHPLHGLGQGDVLDFYPGEEEQEEDLASTLARGYPTDLWPSPGQQSAGTEVVFTKLRQA